MASWKLWLDSFFFAADKLSQIGAIDDRAAFRQGVRHATAEISAAADHNTHLAFHIESVHEHFSRSGYWRSCRRRRQATTVAVFGRLQRSTASSSTAIPCRRSRLCRTRPSRVNRRKVSIMSTYASFHSYGWLSQSCRGSLFAELSHQHGRRCNVESHPVRDCIPPYRTATATVGSNRGESG